MLLAVLFKYHSGEVETPDSWKDLVYAIAFLWMAATVSLSYANNEFEGSTDELSGLKVCVVIPIFNEDPQTFIQMLESLERQTRQPDRVHIIDDGSATRDCYNAYRKWRKTTSLNAVFTKKTNGGKREAQAVGFRRYKRADVYVTIDSDTVLDEAALENSLKPFTNKKVMSVAGLLVGLNDRTNVLTRLVDLGFVTSFINGRAAWSRMRSVAVNCGGLAFYRGFIVQKYLDEYLSQTVFGRKAASGDDRILTNFAALEGWSVFQESSVGYTLLPENMSHLLRQRIRWWRSFFWGGLWLIRRFPINKPLWWLVTWQFYSFFMYTLVLPFAILYPFVAGSFPLILVLYFSLLAYIRNAKYLMIKRPDQPFYEQFVTYLMAPLGSLLNILLCSVLQYFGLATVAKTGWGTRKKVEVGLSVA